MHEQDYREELKGLLEECSVHLEQDLRMIQLLQKAEILSIKQEESFCGQLQKIKESCDSIEKEIEKKKGEKELILTNYKILHLLFDIKDWQERFIEMLENKACFPQDSIKKEMLIYFICESGMKLWMNMKHRHKMHGINFSLQKREVKIQA